MFNKEKMAFLPNLIIHTFGINSENDFLEEVGAHRFGFFV